jgi:MFS superfamily sulfate permease-like transporter
VIASLLALAHQTYDPPVYALGRKRGTDVFRPLSDEHPDDDTWPGLLIMRAEGRIFFANAQRIGEKMWLLIEQTKPSVVLIDFSAVFDIEYTALKMLGEAEEKLRRDGITLWLAALTPDVLTVVQRSRIGETLGRERMFFNLHMAVEKYERSRSSKAADETMTPASVASKADTEERR